MSLLRKGAYYDLSGLPTGRTTFEEICSGERAKEAENTAVIQSKASKRRARRRRSRSVIKAVLGAVFSDKLI